ncbi:hypothetical protein OTU49_004792, partial [Cherax quadricarinatus]
MEVHIQQLVNELTLDKLETLKLQTCWQIAKHLGVTYNNRYITETVWPIIRNILFPIPPEVSESPDSEIESLTSQLDRMSRVNDLEASGGASKSAPGSPTNSLVAESMSMPGAEEMSR